jgi:D-glycerate 3-kinase
MGQPAEWQRAFLDLHQLPPAYLSTAQQWFKPLAAGLAARAKAGHGPLMVAVNGSQGSGKTTLVDYLVAALSVDHELSAVAMSLDDFYLPLSDRRTLGAEIHPLLVTRGVPGTHDTQLLRAVLDQLISGEGLPLAVPRFDKSRDDRCPTQAWQKIAHQPAVVLLEGWCLGASPQEVAELETPLNALEQEEDPDGSWRRYVNQALYSDFLPLYSYMDFWIMLKAPSFGSVHDWRLEQETKLAARDCSGEALMDDAGVARFIQHFQRLTECCLEQLPERVDYLYSLDAQRSITASYKEGVQCQ